MVENINIVEILKDKPQGTKLYSSACGKCKLEEVDDKSFNDSKPTHLAFLDGHVDGFNAGAKWAINEFLKNLWHPAS